MRPSKLEEYFQKQHFVILNKSVVYFIILKDRHEKLPKITKLLTKKSTYKIIDGLKPPYYISYMIATQRKPHTIGETLIVPVLKNAQETVLKISSDNVLSVLTLDNSSVKRKIDKMALNVEEILCNELKIQSFLYNWMSLNSPIMIHCYYLALDT